MIPDPLIGMMEVKYMRCWTRGSRKNKSSHMVAEIEALTNDNLANE
jgi:hypothetical protein